MVITAITWTSVLILRYCYARSVELIIRRSMVKFWCPLILECSDVGWKQQLTLMIWFSLHSGLNPSSVVVSRSLSSTLGWRSNLIITDTDCLSLSISDFAPTGLLPVRFSSSIVATTVWPHWDPLPEAQSRAAISYMIPLLHLFCYYCNYETYVTLITMLKPPNPSYMSIWKVSEV